jgi:hypothetical protein
MDNSTDSFIRFNEHLEKIIATKFPDSILTAIVLTAEKFEIELVKVPKYLSPKYKELLKEEQFIRTDASSLEALI